MSTLYKIIDNPEINMVKGFYANGIHCGLKKENQLDLGMVYSEVKTNTFAMYTTNKIKGAPLLVAKRHLKNNNCRILVVNSKVANTCTGTEGIKNSELICHEASRLFNLKKEDSIHMATGVIGQQLPVDKITNGIAKLKEIIKDKNPNNFSKAIMTTDTFPKIVGVKFNINGKECTIVGTAKGSGMIYPNMATMLAFIFTDVDINPQLLNMAFKNSINKSINAITVDGDTSTNDCAIIFANGMAVNKRIKNKNSFEFKIFKNSLNYVTTTLAKMLARDGEGATKLVEINIDKAKSKKDARKAAMAIGNSNLVKTAIFGEDANWGRIMCALGYSGIKFDPDKTDLYIGDILLFSKGTGAKYSEEEVSKLLKEKEIKINICLNNGSKSFTAWTCDLSYDYVKINGSYRS